MNTLQNKGLSQFSRNWFNQYVLTQWLNQFIKNKKAEIENIA